MVTSPPYDWIPDFTKPDAQQYNELPEELLAHGDGQCFAWVSLFLKAREVHRIQSPDAARVVTPKAAQGFIVQNWTFTDPGTNRVEYFRYFGIPDEPFDTSNAYKWRFSEVNDALGVEGQANGNPASLFAKHWLAKLNGKYYDPSYGGIWNHLQHFDDEAVAGYLNRGMPVQASEAAVNLDLNGDGDKTDTVPLPAQVSEASVGADLNGDGDMVDTVNFSTTVFQRNEPGLDLTE